MNQQAKVGETTSALRGLWRRRIVNAFCYSREGLKACLRSEEAFRTEVTLAVVLTPLGLWLGRDGMEKALLVVPIFLVLIVELLNTAVEITLDRIGTERDERAGRAKDMGSAAVFLSMMLFLVIWGLVLFF